MGPYGLLTLSDTDNETDNKCIELHGNQCRYLSQFSVNTPLRLLQCTDIYPVIRIAIKYF